MLAVSILETGLIGSYTTVPAAEFSAGALAASETLEWITAALGAVGISISVKELLKPRQVDIEKDIGKHIDWDNYDWGDMLDSPAAQDQIDELDKTINRWYGNASAKWKEMYEKSLSPTPTPETSPDKPDPSPPVTVAPIDPDKVTPPGWDTLRKASMKNGYLALGAATYWCLKEAVSNWWDEVFDNDPATSITSNPYSYDDLIGTVKVEYYSGTSHVLDTHYMYNANNISHFDVLTESPSYEKFLYVVGLNASDKSVNFNSFTVRNMDGVSQSFKGNRASYFLGSNSTDYTNFKEFNYSFYLPYVLNGQSFDAAVKPMGKSGIWVNPDLKSDHDKNNSPSIPATAPAPAIKIPSLDDLKDLQKKGNDASDDDRPSIILDWLKDHYTNPSTDPQPTTAPDPDPNPTTAPNPDPDPDPDPNPDPTTTPAINPEPSTAPKPSGTPENPDDTDTDTDIDPDDYKADLRLVFPFCIPFDLVHLIQAFEADPEAPVFEFPVDIELNDPFAGSERSAKKIVDYHHTFELDMSDYEPVIKIFRIFEIIFFIIGLLLITRQQMIKG